MNNQWNIDGVMEGQRKRLEAKLWLAAGIVEKHIKLQCPVDTGNLKGNTDRRVISRDRVRVFNNTEYAPYVEFGTYKMDANPFMRRGYRRAKAEIRKVFGK